jgi:2-polyprenylphenol 6-hydroxylase
LTSRPDFDVIIVGGGLVGAAFARALKESALKLALVEGRPIAPPGPPGQDARVYAVSPGNIAELNQLGIWPRLGADRQTPIQAMQVFGDAGAEIHFDSLEMGRAALGAIAENQALLTACWQELAEQGNLSLFCPAQCADLAVDDHQAKITLADGRVLTARLVVGADGAQSWVRNNGGFSATVLGYAQQAVVANFAIEKPHRQVAYQWFRQPDVLAWLPLPGQRMSMVWSLPEARVPGLMALDAAAFADEVARAGQYQLGRLELLTRPLAFPLRLMHMAQFVQPRLALIGDAAHNVHPLAGQGVNLGFQDAWALAEVLGSGAAARDCGDYYLLRRFERARKSDILAMELVPDGLQRLFAADLPLLRLLRNQGLDLTDRQRWLKKHLMQHAIL